LKLVNGLIAGLPQGENILRLIEFASLIIEVLAVVLIVVAIFGAFGRYLWKSYLERSDPSNYHELKVSLAKTLLLGLEILVAADIVRTVALEATPVSVATLGLLVLVRTFLSWTLVVEIEGRWPWQPPTDAGHTITPGGVREDES
jgi:uncharacterized membrane protein